MTSQYVGTITTMKLFPYLVDAIDFFGTVYVYSAFAVILPIWGLATIKSTDGASLVEVEEIYERGRRKAAIGQKEKEAVKLLRFQDYGAVEKAEQFLVARSNKK